MATTIEDMLAKRPVNRANVDAHKRRMLRDVHSYRLKELRSLSHLTQRQLAGRLNVSQNRISNIEHGELERVQLETLRKYVEAVGGTLRIEVALGSGEVIQLQLADRESPASAVLQPR